MACNTVANVHTYTLCVYMHCSPYFVQYCIHLNFCRVEILQIASFCDFRIFIFAVTES